MQNSDPATGHSGAPMDGARDGTDGPHRWARQVQWLRVYVVERVADAPAPVVIDLLTVMLPLPKATFPDSTADLPPDVVKPRVRPMLSSVR